MDEQRTADPMLESLSHEGQKDAWLDDLLAYLHYNPATKSHRDWVADCLQLEAEVERLRRPPLLCRVFGHKYEDHGPLWGGGWPPCKRCGHE